MTAPYGYSIRYLPPRTTGHGEIIASVTTKEPLTLADIHARWPDMFARAGFYTLLLSLDDQLTVDA